MLSTRSRSLVGFGVSGILIDIECHLSNNLPTIIIVGFASKAVNEAKDRLRGAFASSQLELPRRRITLNLAPADIPKTDSGLDLAMAVSILAASEQVMPLSPDQAVIGELGLDGVVRPVRGIIGKLLAGRQRDVTEYFIPAANLAQAQLIPGLTLYPVDSLRTLYEHLAARRDIVAITTGNGIHEAPPAEASLELPQLSAVVGQTLAKRALLIAAAGGHNLLLNGPPGTGKSMLAKALPSLLPPLGQEEILEVTQLQSLANHDYERLFTSRPIRSPHHSASHTAIIGGGGRLKPGEISLSHRGVLFLDELPEFDRTTLEALRQPLEDRIISISRAKDNIEYPANFILIATANPCPCGYKDSARACICTAKQLNHYKTKLSGPILDRIDLCCDVHSVDHSRLLGSEDKIDDQSLKTTVATARQRQAVRFGNTTKLNADMNGQELKRLAHITPDAIRTLNIAATNLGLSTRAYLRVIKVARTIADLEASTAIETPHLSEALAYRQRSAGGTGV